MSVKTAPVRSLGALRGRSYDKGRGFAHQLGWTLASHFVVTKVWCPNTLRCAILRFFGAQLGSGVLIKHDVDIQWPWNLTMGDNSWLGVGVSIANIAPVTLGSDVCVSQQAFICSGSHDYRSPVFEYDNRPIVIEDGVWIGARATVLRGVTVGARSVVGSQSLVVKDIPTDSLASAPTATVRTLIDE